ncbi:MAG: bifunctional DNA-formamidopyrimidine glycosylase/DNA-(apurinic or apyrimidinic site) lyase [Acidimicrobiia bacterium]
MPELPEVETVRRDLAEHVVGRTIVSARVHGARTVRRHNPEMLCDAMSACTIIGARRRGKYLVVDLAEERSMVVHLRMSGQLRLHRDEPDAPHTHAWFDLDDGSQLRFIDPRTFGELFVCPTSEVLDAPGLCTLGPDAHDALPSLPQLAATLGGRCLALKGFLLRQDLLAGIGNIYSDEICARARLRHDRRTDSLSRGEIRRLHGAIGTVLDAAIEHRGSSLSDAQYVDLFGRTGHYQALHEVYAREGEPCSRCGRPIVRTAFAQRSTFGCPRCQR